MHGEFTALPRLGQLDYGYTSGRIGRKGDRDGNEGNKIREGQKERK